MAFPNYNTTSSLYVNAPWIGPIAPTIVGIKTMQLRPFLPVETQSQAGLLRPGIGYLYRLILGPEWPNRHDYNWRVEAVSPIHIVPDGMPASDMALKVEARMVYYLNGGLLYSYNILSLALNPAIYP